MKVVRYLEIRRSWANDLIDNENDDSMLADDVDMMALLPVITRPAVPE